MRDHPFGRQEEGETNKHFPGLHQNDSEIPQIIHEAHRAAVRYSPDLATSRFSLPRRNSGAATWNWFSVFFAQGPPLHSFAYVSKYNCPSTRLKYSSILTHGSSALPRTSAYFFYKILKNDFQKGAHRRYLRSKEWLTWTTLLYRKHLWFSFKIKKTRQPVIFQQRQWQDDDNWIKKIKAKWVCKTVPIGE